ncbi:MAG: type 4a pilus biogenesis protein PilO [Candidatus Daviesbacteria bacterium]|nr:type 4a pilus biogenesis protein PilO [Candidatus Daviesbacteria bacterium]
MKKEDLVKFYSKYSLYIFPAVVALSSIFIILFVIYPQVIKLIDNQNSIEDLLNKSEFLENKVSALENYDNADLSRRLEVALAALPGEKDLGSVLGLLQKMTIESDFSINSISFGNAAGKSGNSNSFEVELEIKGSRARLPNLFSNLENSSRLVRIKSIDISSNQASQDLDVALAIEVLYSPLPKDFGGPDSPVPQLSQKDEELIARIMEEAIGISGSSVLPSSSRGRSNPFE